MQRLEEAEAETYEHSRPKNERDLRSSEGENGKASTGLQSWARRLHRTRPNSSDPCMCVQACGMGASVRQSIAKASSAVATSATKDWHGRSSDAHRRCAEPDMKGGTLIFICSCRTRMRASPYFPLSRAAPHQLRCDHCSRQLCLKSQLPMVCRCMSAPLRESAEPVADLFVRC
jgi:hypothetical protein